MIGRVLCRLGLHRWVRKLTVDNEPFVACKRCDKVNTSGPGPGDKYFLPQGGMG